MNARLDSLTSVEAGVALHSAKLAILPLGAIEQHGSHLALSTDISVATALATRLDAALGAKSILCPPVPYGLSEHHLAFPGTITLRPSTLIRLILDVVESLAANGITRVLVVNGHGGNVDAIRLAAREAKRDHGSLVAHLMWAQVASDAISEEMAGRGMHNHACEIETSLALELCPEIVRDEPPGPADVYPLDSLVAPPTARVDVPLWFDQLTPTGALGDPSRASAALGKRLTDLVLERGQAFAEAFVTDEFPLARP